MKNYSNKWFDKTTDNYQYFIKEYKKLEEKLKKIINKFNYIKFPNKLHIFGYGKKGELNLKYVSYYNLKFLNKFPKNKLAIVTGFGPTNPPTAGTLASIFRVLDLQKHTGIYTHIIISEFSAFNSRKRPLAELIKNSYQFISFIKKLGFDERNGEIRTNNHPDHIRVFSLVSSVLTTKDLLKHLEITTETYNRLNLLGNDFSRMISRAYTITDIILPIIRDNKLGVIVPIGIEEHHHPLFAKMVIDRLKNKDLDSLVPKDAEIGALHGKIIRGLFPYIKMSKSIPESSISLDNSIDELEEKIINSGEKNEEVILQMIELASNWDMQKIKEAKNAFKRRKANYKIWKDIKYEYFKFFIEIKKLWEESKYQKHIDLHQEIFRSFSRK